MLQGQAIYRGIDEFTDRISRRVRGHLLSAGVGCDAVQRSFKPTGSGFVAVSMSGNYFVSVFVESDALPEAQIVTWADPRRGAVRSWSWFEPLFRRAVESEFSDYIKWMTTEEYGKSSPSV